jgi:hypothetical protein
MVRERLCPDITRLKDDRLEDAANLPEPEILVPRSGTSIAALMASSGELAASIASDVQADSQVEAS